MYVFNRFLGSFINKLTWFVLIAIIGLVCFFGGLWVANAETCTSLNITGTSATFNLANNSNVGDYYSHNKIRDIIPTLLNQNDNFVNYYGTYTLYNFYQRFNYAVQQQDGEYFRIYYQDINFLQSVSCADVSNKFYIGSFFSTGNYNYNLNIPYSFYLDIHFNLSDNSIVIDNISTLSDNLNAISINNRKFSSYPSWSSWSFTIPLIDSYNGLQLLNNIESVAYQTYIESLNSYFDNKFPNITIINSTNTNINELSLAFSGTEVTEDTEEPDPENPGGVDYSGVLNEIKDQLDKQEQAIQESNSILGDIFDSIGSNFTDFREEVAGGFNEVGKKIGDGIDSIIEWFSETFDSESDFNDWINEFSQEDNGGISQIITAPLRLIYSLDDSNDCEPLRFTIWGKEVGLPNGCLLWSLATTEIITTYHVVIYGFLTYRILVELFLLIERLKDPKEREVDTLDL